MANTKDSIIQILNTTYLDDKTLDDVLKIISINQSNYQQLSQLLKTLKFIEYNDLAKNICIRDYSEVVPTLIENTISESDLPKQTRFNIIDLLYSKGVVLGLDVLNFLINYKHSSPGHIIGKGETLMRILMKGTPSMQGDLIVEDKKYEVKFNKSRLKGMSGFYQTDSSQVAIHLDLCFSDCCNFSVLDSNRWNFVSGNRLKPYLFTEAVLNSKKTVLECCEMFVDSFRWHFSEMTIAEEKDLALSLSLEFDQDRRLIERMGYSKFIYKMTAYALKYYAACENFDGMIVLNDEFECMYLTRDFIDNESLEDLSDFVLKNFNITPASLTVKAGPQGSAFGISLL